MSGKITFASVLLATTCLLPAMAFAQSRADCDRLITEIDARQGQELSVTRQQVDDFIQKSDFAACQRALQQVQAQAQPQEGGQQQAQGQQQPGAQQAAEGSNIVVQQPAPAVTVEQAPPQVTVQQPQPNVTVSQPQPEIIVNQPAPVVTVDIPQPEIIVRMPPPDVNVSQAQPQVEVIQPQPQVQVVQQEKPQVQVQEGEQPTVQVQQSEGQANVQVEQAGEPKVTYQRAEPRIQVNQAEGQPTVRFEQMGEGNQQAAAQQPGQQPPNQQRLAGAEPDGQGEQPASAMNRQMAASEPDQGQQPADQLADQTASIGAQSGQVPVSEIEGMDVVDERGEQIGEAQGMVLSSADNKHYVLIDQGGFLGLGEKQVALSLEGLMMQGDRIMVPTLTEEQIRALPEFQEGAQFTEVAGGEVAQFRTAQQ